MTAPGYRLDEAVEAVLTELSDRSLLDGVGDDLHREIGEAIVKAVLAAAPQPETPANGTFWAWLCNGKGDGWEEKDKVVHDPDLVKMRRERPDLWRIEGLYRAAAPGVDEHPEPPEDLKRKALKWIKSQDLSDSDYDLLMSADANELMAAFAQEHAAAEKARADKAEKALADIVDTWTRAHTAPEYATAIRARKGGGDE